MCHYCGHSEPLPKHCPQCGGLLSFSGTGTQRAEEELQQLFPDAEILRMDTDTVTAARSHEDILEEFFGEIQDEYDFEENPIVPLDGDGNQVQVDARTNVSEIAEFFDTEIEENADFDTVGGLVSFELGRVGAVGDEVTVAGLRFAVLEANEKCILKVEVSRLSKTETQDA